ncbi:hypothetical protein ETAA8_59760 [Anatilimnocola aggregata]|uniref:DUF1428 domain-containing protein n=1 Tax=Anatilimnocola aggregata TaxID=2528021 RepID=A0A517YKS3_9BACT|nr:DUF1428 domain-containing protein [Anatilimnocola aggregata]QDU30827.1 hypothetical protein ETAA8_59760 [Anatilimnocola aggregata]
MSYVDGFLFCVPEAKLPDFVKIAKKACKIWLEHGALEYFECQGEDLEIPNMLSFNKVAKPKAGEVVLFSFIIYKSRKHRDQVNKKVMADPRIHEGMDPNNMPFDCKRMAYGGFKALVEAKAKSA